MKKTLLLIVPFLLLLSPLLGQKKTEKPNPKKGIKTETILKYEYEEKFGELEVILEGKYIYKYDSNGNNVEWSMYDSEGNLTDNVFGVSKTIYKYDSKNRIIESISYDFESKFGELQEIPEGKTIYQYEEY